MTALAPRVEPLPDRWLQSQVRSGFARTDDGEQLYWRCVGPDVVPKTRRRAPPPPLTIACCNGVGVSTFFWKYLVDHLRVHHRVVVWDYRGHGRSTVPRDIAAADLSMERNADDLVTVLDAIGATEPAILLGHSMGCQVILETHRRNPGRVRALVPMFGTWARPLDTFMDFPNSKAVFERLHAIASKTDRTSRRWLLPLYASPMAFDFSRFTGLVDSYFARQTDIVRYTDHLGHMHPDVFLSMLARMAEHDLTDHLPHVDVPTLVFGAENDLFTPAHRSRRMAELIPGAELLVLAAASHAAIVEHPETICMRLDRFLQERVLRPG